MGWASGTELFDDIMAFALPKIDQDHRNQLFKEMLELFMDHDWDCINESRYWNDPDFQTAYQTLCPDY
jgi:hypothetical protein